MTQMNPFGGPPPQPPAGGYLPATPPPAPAGPGVQSWGPPPVGTIVPASARRRAGLSGRLALVAVVGVLGLLTAGVWASGAFDGGNATSKMTAREERAAARASERRATPPVGSRAAPKAKLKAKAAPKRAPAKKVPAKKVPAKPSPAHQKPPAKKTAPSTPRVVPVPSPAKPAVAPKVAPPGTAWVQVTVDNSGTHGAPYRLASPFDHALSRGIPITEKGAAGNIDVVVADEFEGRTLAIISLEAPGVADGTLSPAMLRQARDGFMNTSQSTLLPGMSSALIAGVTATGFDVSETDDEAGEVRQRVLWFGRGEVLYVVTWATATEDFDASLPAFTKLVTTMAFTGPAGPRRSAGTQTQA